MKSRPESAFFAGIALPGSLIDGFSGRQPCSREPPEPSTGPVEYLRSFGLFGLWQLWQSSGPEGRVHFMIAEKSSDVKVKRVSRLAESKSRCCISHNFGGFYQIIPCIRPAVVRIKGAHGCPATIRIFVLGRAVQTWQREPGGRPMPPAMEAIGARSTIRERGSRGQSLSPLRLSSEWVGWG